MNDLAPIEAKLARLEQTNMRGDLPKDLYDSIDDVLAREYRD